MLDGGGGFLFLGLILAPWYDSAMETDEKLEHLSILLSGLSTNVDDLLTAKEAFAGNKEHAWRTALRGSTLYALGQLREGIASIEPMYEAALAELERAVNGDTPTADADNPLTAAGAAFDQGVKAERAKRAETAKPPAAEDDEPEVVEVATGVNVGAELCKACSQGRHDMCGRGACECACTEVG